MNAKLASPLIVAALALGVASPVVLGGDDDSAPKKKKREKPAEAEAEPRKLDDEEVSAKLAPEARLCVKIARGEVIRGIAVEPYLDLLSDGDVAAWNAKRKKDGGKLLDLAGRTQDARSREEAELKLEGLDLSGADLSNVIFPRKTSFRFTDLSGATFKGSCLEGAEFSSVWPFSAGPRSASSVRSTSLANADLREAVWTWCSALERTVTRAFDDGPREDAQSRQRTLAERQQRLALQLQRLQGYMQVDGFAFADLEGARFDKDSGMGPLDEVEEQRLQPQMRRSRTLERLLRAARSGQVDRAIARLVERRQTARTRECRNPLRNEAALCEAIAAVDSRLTGIGTWKAVRLAELAGQNPSEDATIVGEPQAVLVVDDERTFAAGRLLVSPGPVVAWCKGALPTTFCSSVVVLKDQAYTHGVIHGHPVFALAEGLRGPNVRVAPTAGTFHSEVVVEVNGVENLSQAEAEHRALVDAKLKDYALAQGDDMQHQPVWNPAKADEETLDPQDALPADIRKALKAQLGKNALDGMTCYKLSGQKGGQNGNAYYHVLSNDPKAILVVDPSFVLQGSIYSEGPVVFTGTNQKSWIQRCVTKSWLFLKGRPQVQQFVYLGKRIDAEEKEKQPDEEKPDEPKEDK